MYNQTLTRTTHTTENVIYDVFKFIDEQSEYVLYIMIIVCSPIAKSSSSNNLKNSLKYFDVEKHICTLYLYLYCIHIWPMNMWPVAWYELEMG